MSTNEYSEKTPSRFIVYAIHHPSSLYVYVGKSSRGMVRPLEHGKDCHKKDKHSGLAITNWIRKRESLGQSYEIAVLEECANDNEALDSEKFYIAYFRSIGMLLLNLTDGGEGVSGIRKSSESIAKTANALRGRKHSNETRAKMSAAWSKPEPKAKIAAANKKRVWTDESRAKVGAVSSQIVRTPEWCAKIGAANSKRIWTPEMIEKRTASRKRNRELKESLLTNE
jgi:hypothetical protein